MHVSICVDYRVHIRVWSLANIRDYSYKIKERQRLFKAITLCFYVVLRLLTSLFSHHIFAEEMSANALANSFLRIWNIDRYSFFRDIANGEIYDLTNYYLLFIYNLWI